MKHRLMNTLNKIALVLCIIGGLNWGSIGFFQFDFIAWIFGGQDSMVSRIVYVIVAVAAVWCISIIFEEEEEPPHVPIGEESDVPDIGIS